MLRLVQVGSDFPVIELVADIPVRVVVSRISARVDSGVHCLRYGVVGEAKLDLGKRAVP